MPEDYSCTSCGLGISIGSYHGFSGEWFNALYCRHCGTRYRLKQTIIQAWSLDRPTSREFELIGPKSVRSLVVSKGGECPTVTCDHCGIEGLLGARGPITDEKPEFCPRCKKPTMKLSGEWIT